MEQLLMPLAAGQQRQVTFQKFMELSLEMKCAFDLEGKFAFISGASKGLLGYKAPELLGKHYADYLYSPEFQKEFEKWDESIWSGEILETNNHFVHKDGSLVHLQWKIRWCAEEALAYAVAREVTELETSTQLLREAELRYRTLMDNGYEVINITSPDGICKFASESVTRILGYQPDELIGKNGFQFIHPEDVEIASKAFQNGMQGSTQPSAPYRFRAANGSWRWLEAIITNHLSTSSIQGIVLKTRDITDRVETEKKLQVREQRYKSLFENHPDAVFSMNTEGTLQAVNRSGSLLLQHSETQIINRHFTLFIHPKQREECKKLFASSLSGGAHYLDTVYLNKEEEKVNISLTVIPIMVDGKVEGVYAIARDISAAKKTERDLQKLSQVASKVKNAIVVTDKYGKFEWVNEAFTEETGFTITDVKGKYPAQALSGPKTEMDVHRRIAEKVSVTKELAREEVLRYNKDGSMTWVHLELSPILDEKGNLQRVVSITTDITEIKQAQQERARLTDELVRQNKDLHQFGYIVSHNLRAPVANILGLVQLLPQSLGSPETAAKIIKKLEGATQRLDTVIRDLNQILTVRSEVIELKKEICLKKEVADILMGIQHQIDACGAVIHQDFSAGCQLFSVRSYVTSILQNLITNAIKYRSPDRPLQIKLSTIDSDEYLCFIIEDNGLGINLQKEKENLFKLYKRFHFHTEGKGLGLHLVKTQIEALGGKIDVESTLQVGTHFRAYFKK